MFFENFATILANAKNPSIIERIIDKEKRHQEATAR